MVKDKKRKKYVVVITYSKENITEDNLRKLNERMKEINNQKLSLYYLQLSNYIKTYKNAINAIKKYKDTTDKNQKKNLKKEMEEKKNKVIKINYILYPVVNEIYEDSIITVIDFDKLDKIPNLNNYTRIPLGNMSIRIMKKGNTVYKINNGKKSTIKIENFKKENEVYQIKINRIIGSYYVDCKEYTTDTLLINNNKNTTKSESVSGKIGETLLSSSKSIAKSIGNKTFKPKFKTGDIVIRINNESKSNPPKFYVESYSPWTGRLNLKKYKTNNNGKAIINNIANAKFNKNKYKLLNNTEKNLR